MKLKKSVIIGISAILTFAAIGISSAAWFQISNSQTIATTGSTAAAYFAGGKGTVTEPYIITRPIHMYNLAWLQYNGEFNNANAPYYFQIGGDGTDYPVVTELNMSGYTLPPIGTTAQPFIGVFNGNDATITNLAVSNVYGTSDGNITKKPTKIATSGTLSGVNIVGVFGVVGDYAGAASSYNTSATSIYDLNIKDTTVRSQLTSTLIGVAAGYVNGDVLSNVGIINSTINLPDNSTAYSNMTTNVSDFSVIGYQKADEGKPTLTTSHDTISVPASSRENTVAENTGNVAAWGASIDMKSLYGRVLQKYTEADAEATYTAGVAVGTATQIITVDNTVSPATREEGEIVYTGVSQYYQGDYKKNYKTNNDAGKLEGQYFFKTDSRTRFILLGGNSNKFDEGDTAITVTTKTKNSLGYNGYTFSATTSALKYHKIAVKTAQSSFYAIKAVRGGTTYYMTDGGTYASASTDVDDSPSWVFSNLGGSGTIRTSNGNNYLYWDSNKTYCQNGGNNNNARAFTTNTSTKKITFTRNSQYLYFTGNINTNGTSWQLTSDANADGIATYEKITIPSVTYYLQVSGSSFDFTEDINASGTDWIFSNDRITTSGQTTTIRSALTGQYLYCDTSSISMSDSTRSWTFDGTGMIYYETWRYDYYLGLNASGYIGVYRTPSVSATVFVGKSFAAGTVYLAVDENGGLITVQTSDEATKWRLSNESEAANTTSTIYTTVGGNTRYLRGSTTNNTVMTTNASSETFTLRNGHYASRNNNNYYYLSFIGGIWRVNTATTNAMNRSATASNTVITSTSESVSKPIKNENNGYYETYMPLNVQGETTVTTKGESNNTASTTSFAPTDTNTGYLISGGSYGVDPEAGSYDNKNGDIRVSWFNMSDMEHSHNGITSYTTSNRSQLEVITRTQNSGGWVRISDDYNKDNTTLASGNATNCNYGISDIENKITYEKTGLNLQKYKSSRNQLDTTFLQAPKYIYGLHFMDATISKDNLCVAEKVHIDEHDYDNYEMPRDSIDFNLRENGYINFFAGTYYNNSTTDQNNSFFSLNKIERNETTHQITAIHQISKIYGKDGDPSYGFWYYYDDDSDGTIDGYCGPEGENTSAAAGWAQVFDCDWIMQRSDLVMDALYYFEIPVSAGEYALGSVPSSNPNNTAKGAYLMYLDIGASAARVNRTIVWQTITKDTDVYIYPRGIAIIANAAEDVIDYISAAYTLSAGYKGDFTMSKTGDTITSDADTGQEYVATFKGEGITLVDADTSAAPTINKYSTESSVIHRTTFIDYNRSAKEYSMTVIDDYMNAAGTAIDHRVVRKRSSTTENDQVVWGDWVTLEELGDYALDKYTATHLNDQAIGHAYSYYAADGVELTIEWGLDYTQDGTVTNANYQNITGLVLTISGETTVVNPEDIVVTNLDGQTAYTIRINNTTITVTIDGDNKTFTPPTISITPTVVPPNNP